VKTRNLGNSLSKARWKEVYGQTRKKAGQCAPPDENIETVINRQTGRKIIKNYVSHREEADLNP